MEILADFLIALAIGMTGVGAGSITAPILILFFHKATAEAVTASLLFATIVKVVATPVYWSRGQVNFPVLKHLLLGGLPGVLAGSFLLSRLNQASMTRSVLIFVGATVVLTAAATLWRSLSGPVSGNPIAGKWLSWMVAPIGFEVGFSSAGAGALGTLVLMRFSSLAPSEVVGTDLAFGLLLSAVGGGLHAGLNGVPWSTLTDLLVGGVPGVLIGAQLASVLPSRKMRVALCVWLIYIGSHLSYRGYEENREPRGDSAGLEHVRR